MSMNRRHFMKHVAGYSALALPGIEFVRTIKANAQSLRAQNKSVIILWMGGGPPTIDIWDLKPGRPTGGEFKEISTSADGVKICEHMPKVAEQFRHLNVIRSLTTTEGDHMRGTQLMHTAFTPNPAIAFPSMGAVAAKKAPELAGYHDISLPSYLAIGTNGGGPGFLGMNYAPFNVQQPGNMPENVRAPGSLGNGNEIMDRLQRRNRLFHMVEDPYYTSQAAHLSAAERPRYADASKAHMDVYGKAFSLIASRDGQVFDLKSEPTKLMEEYGAAGTGSNNFGRAAILARKLVAAGVSAVELSMGGWDLHQQTHQRLAAGNNALLPQLDKAMGTLVKDLVDRGMWQNTVVVWMGEFGRTPRINQNAGRDHWSRCWSVVVGGGGMKGGQAYGSTDADGMAVANNPVRVTDLFATVYKAMGIDPTSQVRDSNGRPYPISGLGGRPVENLF
jgi:hypothetical protein